MKESEINALRNEALYDQIKTERPAKAYPGAMDDCDAVVASLNAEANQVFARGKDHLCNLGTFSSAAKLIIELKESNDLLAKKVAELEGLVPRWISREEYARTGVYIKLCDPRTNDTGQQWFCVIERASIPQPPKGESQ